MGRGRGEDARVGLFEFRGLPVGARFILRTSPTQAVQLGLDQFVAEGFDLRNDDLHGELARRGSAWTACALQIGDAKRSLRRGLLADLVEDTPLEILPVFARGISPTLVVVSARPLPDGTAELVIYPHTSGRGHPDGATGAAPRIRAAYDRILARATDDELLVAAEKMRGIRNDGSPASQQMVRELLGWR